MFRLKVNQLDNSLKEKIGMDFNILKEHTDVIFNTKFDNNLELKIKVPQDQFLKEGFVEWEYCIHPGKDLWLTRKSSMNDIGLHCQEILERKMFHNSYLEELEQIEE